MIISTFSVCLHLAAGEVSSRNEVTLTFYKCGSELLPAAVWSAGGSPSLFSDLKNKKRK